MSTASSSALPFGSASAYSETLLGPPAQINVPATTCFQLSVFKDVMKQYRKLDDTIIIRLNRANAQLRDENRSHNLPPTSGMSDSCLHLWREMMSGWAHRQTLLSFCLNNVDASLAGKRRAVEGQEMGLSNRQQEPSIFGEQVLRNQLANEASVEAIVRKRSLDAFKSSCKFFSPPVDDPNGRSWWEAAEAAR